MLYFSATGNSKYIAELFGGNMNAPAHSVEENLDFEALIAANDTIGFCYPIYFSRVPRILREFVDRYMELLKGKKLIIFCTQQLLSGDGARAFAALFPRNHVQVIYAEHIFMPSNIWPVMTNKRLIKKFFIRAKPKMQAVCRNIKHGVVKKRGFNVGSQALGLIQAPIMPWAERKALESIRINSDCNGCGVCVAACPMKNLACEDGGIVHYHNCTLCYRCVNKCPQKAITVVFHGKVKAQYEAPKGSLYATP
jgi:ferredoxin